MAVDDRVPGPPRTANELYFDAALRHQIGLRRYSAGLNKRIATLLQEADTELAERLRVRLRRFEGRPLDYTGERWRALLQDMATARTAALSEVRKLAREELLELTGMEAAREAAVLQSAIPIEVSFATVAADQLRAIVSAKPFQGRLLREWFNGLEFQDRQRLQTALQLGMTAGETTDEIVRRVVGTRKAGYTDGILSTTRRDAEAVVRTAVNHVSNTARGYVWEANNDIIAARIWVSTLDGRTSAVCRARDGKGRSTRPDGKLPPGIEALKPPNATPPAHINCRSAMAAYIDGVGLIGKRPTVTDTRTREKREIDFRRIARQEGRPIQDVRREWAEKNVGRVPAATTYQEFMKRQPASFQNEVLGRTKAQLFRKGGLELDHFVDRAGNELNLAQLAATRPEAFEKAGLDPANF